MDDLEKQYGTSSMLRKLCASIQRHLWIQIGVLKRPILVKIGDFFVSRDLEIWQMSLKNNRAPFYVLSSFENHFLAFGELELELPSRNASYG